MLFVVRTEVYTFMVAMQYIIHPLLNYMVAELFTVNWLRGALEVVIQKRFKLNSIKWGSL